MKPLDHLRTQLQDRFQYGEAIGPDLRHLWRWFTGPSRKRWRELRQRVHRRLRPNLLWSDEVSVRGLLESGQALAHGLSDFEELQAAAPVPINSTGPFAARLHASYPPSKPLMSRRVFRCRLRNPRLHLGEGLLVTRAGGFLLDSAFARYRLVLSRVHGQPLPAQMPLVTGHCTAVWGLFDANIYHWIVDSLSRLHSLESSASEAQTEPLTLLLPAQIPAYHLETLRLCLPEGIALRQMEHRGWVEVEDFHFASHITWGGCVSLPRTHSAALQKRVWERLSLSPDHVGTRRIFISRRDAPTRHILNEPEVMEALRPLGFESVQLEHLSFAEQVRLFHDAQIVVAPHGAGLTNMLFSSRLQVVELQTEQLSLHYFYLAQSLGHPYFSVLAPLRRSSHFIVPIADLLEKLAAIV